MNFAIITKPSEKVNEYKRKVEEVVVELSSFIIPSEKEMKKSVFCLIALTSSSSLKLTGKHGGSYAILHQMPRIRINNCRLKNYF